MDSNKLVWFPDNTHGYAIGRVVDIGQTSVAVQPVAWPQQCDPTFELERQAESANSHQYPYQSVFPCDQIAADNRSQVQVQLGAARTDPKLTPDFDDSCALIQLHEAALLDNVRIRFHRDKIYTYVAHILIAVNPYFQIEGLHSTEAIRQYQGKSLGTMPPHVYAIADKAYRDMKAFKQSQSIIISGESGAGKTESQKYVLRYLCLSGSQSGRLEKLILDANPLLEAFGNAKTTRNNNSSRFGKFIEIHYSNKFTVSGGLFFHYLLEKTRICTQSAGERNYHIFYQLCSCLPDALWHQLELAPPDQFHYLSEGCTQYFCDAKLDSRIADKRKSRSHLAKGSISDQLIDDVRCFEQTDKALSDFGLDDDNKRAIYTIVAAVLHLGNIDFMDDPDGNRGGCQISSTPKSADALQTTARLIQLEADLLRQALITRIMSTARGGHKGTVYMVQLSCQQAQAARDALAKAIYSKLFDYIVTRIVNKSIPFTQSAYYIGVLDVAGFEYFQHNSFEQFLINFCNEKLQQFFNERILKEEQNIYEKEGLNLQRIDFVDNQDCIQLFETKSTGIFDLLDEESRLPKPSAEHFTQSVHSSNKGHFRLAVPRSSKLRVHRELRDDEGFLIRHFAGAVCYSTQTFIEKNNDALHASLKSLMLESDNELLRELFAQDQLNNKDQQETMHYNLPIQSAASLAGNIVSVPSAKNKLNFISVGTTFRSQLLELMSKLRSTGSHFIRCIKPNSEMVAHKFEGAQILSQLHCSGMDSVLRLMQQGYPSRSSFNDLYQTYKQYLPKELARLDAHLFCRALFKAIGLSDSDFRFGSSKVFFRPAKFAEFDQIVRSDSAHVAELVRRVSKWLLRWRWRQVQYCTLSVIKLARKIVYRREQILLIQRCWRAAIVQRHLSYKLKAIRSAKLLKASLDEFEQVTRKQLRSNNERMILEQESGHLRNELDEFVAAFTCAIQQTIVWLASAESSSSSSSSQVNTNLRRPIDTNNNGHKALRRKDNSNTGEDRRACEQQLDQLRTKRDLLVRSIKDKIAKQRELADLERQVALENKRREDEELARRRDEELKRQRQQLELKRQAELSRQQQVAAATKSMVDEPASKQLVDCGTDPISGHWLDQEQRDYDIAVRLSQDNDNASSSGASRLQHQQSVAARAPLPPSENLAHARELPVGRFDLTKWKYSDLRDTINTSCDLELLEACKREFHRRLKIYHAWRAMNTRANDSSGTNGSDAGMRAPSSIIGNGNGAGSDLSAAAAPIGTGGREQRYFRIPFLKNAAGRSSSHGPTIHQQQQQQQSTNSGQRGWWFAHFDGQWIARQLELHPGRAPILLVAGKHDIDMCELSLNETRLTSKRGAEILAQEFEDEWTRHGGEPYENHRK